MSYAQGLNAKRRQLGEAHTTLSNLVLDSLATGNDSLFFKLVQPLRPCLKADMEMKKRLLFPT